MATIIKLKPKKPTHAKYAVRWADNEKVVERKFHAHHQAVEFRAQKNVELIAARKRTPQRRSSEIPTFKVVGDAFLASKKNPLRGEPLARKTLKGYGSYLSERVYPLIGSKLVHNVSASDIEALYDRSVEMGYARKTRKETLRLIRAVLRYAKKSGYLSEVPEIEIDTKPTRKEKIKERRNRENKSYSPDEVYTMLAAADSLALDDNKQIAKAWQRYRAMVYFLAYTGARIGEARAFHRDNFSPSTRKIKITEAASEGGDIGDVKTERGYRKIPLHPVLEQILRERLDQTNLTLVFGTASDLPNSLGNLHNRMLGPLKDRADELAEKKADIRYVKINRDRAFHAFRHHYASQLVNRGANLKRLQTYMGHASAAFTLDVYGHLFDDEDDEIALGMEF